MRQLLVHVKSPSLWAKFERLLPSYRRDVAEQNRIVRESLLPHIRSHLHYIETRANAGGAYKTVIGLALDEIASGEFQNDHSAKYEGSSSELIDTVESQLRLFISAGHDTTAQAMYVTVFVSRSLWSMCFSLTCLVKMLDSLRDQSEA